MMDCCCAPTLTETQKAGLLIMLVGFCRVRTADTRQAIDLQRDALKTARVDEHHLLEDRASRARYDWVSHETCAQVGLGRTM